MTIQNLIIIQTAKYANNIFFITDSKNFTYQDIFDKSLKIAHFFHSKGIKQGDYVIHHHLTKLDSIIIFYATQLLGAIFVPLNHDWSDQICEEIIDRIGPAMYIGKHKFNLNHINITFENLVKSVSETVVQLDFIQTLPLLHSKDISSVLFTSGTTGTPKGVILSHETLYKKAVLFTQFYEWNESDILLSLGEIHSIDRLRNGLIAPLFVGNSVVVDQKQKKLFLDIANLVEKHKCTLASFTPTLLRQFNSFYKDIDTKKLDTLRFIGAPGNIFSKQEKNNFFHIYNKKIVSYYGLTEVGGFSICVSPYDNIETSHVGFPIGCEVKIIDKDGKEVPYEVQGELIIKNNIPFMLGYFNDPVLTQAIIQGDWIHTSDLATKHLNGSIQIHGRMGDLFKNAYEELINPSEIEMVLQEHPLINECCVFDYRGRFSETRIAAIISTNIHIEDESSLFRELKELSLRTLGRQKSPTFYKIFQPFPKTSTGKIMRKELKNYFIRSKDADIS